MCPIMKDVPFLKERFFPWELTPAVLAIDARIWGKNDKFFWHDTSEALSEVLFEITSETLRY